MFAGKKWTFYQENTYGRVYPDGGQSLPLDCPLSPKGGLLYMSFRRFLFFVLVIFLAAAGIYSLLPEKPLPAAFNRLVEQQVNPFTVPVDSIPVVKQRILTFLNEPRHLLSRDRIQAGDSVWQIPYYNSYEKGDRIRIEMHQAGDSCRFTCFRWYSRQADEDGSREIALFIQKGVSRFDFE